MFHITGLIFFISLVIFLLLLLLLYFYKLRVTIVLIVVKLFFWFLTVHISFAVWNLQCNFKMLSKIFKDDINVTFETWLYVAFIYFYILIYPSVLTMRIMYILWYVYQYMNRGIAKPTQLYLRPLKTRFSPRIRQFEPGRHSALCWTIYFTLVKCMWRIRTNMSNVCKCDTVNFEILKGKNFSQMSNV